jgi:hypothetical protein
LNRSELDRFFATVSRRMEVVFCTKFTDRIVENLLCKTFRVLSNNGQQEAARWCDTLIAQQQLYQFNHGSTLVISADGSMEEVEGNAIIHRFPFHDQLLTMAELISELELKGMMPSESRIRKYRIPRNLWYPKVKFEVDFKVPVVRPLSTKGIETTNRILNRWIGEPRIPRKRRRGGD